MKRDIDEINETFDAVFSSPAGKVVLDELRRITVQIVVQPDKSDAYLRFMEGRRSLVQEIEYRMRQSQAKRGKKV